MKKVLKWFLLVAFLPFTLCYLIIAKTNWSRPAKVVAVMGVLVFFIVAFNMDDTSTATSSQVAVKAAETPKPTIVSTPAPTESPEQIRDENIENQASIWDGSHKESVELIKKNMNDPKSFEHVETRFWDMKDHLVVTTTFRGKNAFGGVVLNSVRTKVNLTDDGKIVDVEIYE